MKARVNADCRWSTVTAFAGREYVKSEWRKVPDGCEEEAARHEMFDTRDKRKDPDLEALRAQAKAGGVPRYWLKKEATLRRELAAIEAKQ